MEPYLGEIRIWGLGFAPNGWALCDGRLLRIRDFAGLFSLIGTKYGGDGIETFAIPDMRGRIPFDHGKSIEVAQVGGEEKHQLTIAEMPRHTHSVFAGQGAADQSSPANNYWAGNTGMSPFSDTFDTTLAKGAISEWGSDQAHENMPPFLVLNFTIALWGIYPSVN